MIGYQYSFFMTSYKKVIKSYIKEIYGGASGVVGVAPADAKQRAGHSNRRFPYKAYKDNFFI